MMFNYNLLTDTIEEIQMLSIFKMLHQGNHYTFDFLGINRLFCVYFLTIVFTSFIVILSIVYIHPDLQGYYRCDYTVVSKVPELRYDESAQKPLAINYVAVLPIEDYAADSDDSNVLEYDDFSFIQSFLPDVSDLVVSDDFSQFQDIPSITLAEYHDVSDTADREALTSVKMAIKFKQTNQLDKARKLFHHAMVLSPNHPDVILHYGEFLESDKDLINADHFYHKALMLRPKCSRALVNVERTRPVVNEMDLKEVQEIDMKRAALVRMDNRDPALKRLKKEIYFQHIYHSVAIEGNTLSLDDTRSIVETGLAVSGKSILEHNEILGVEAALRYVNQTVSKKNFSVTSTDILEIHRRVMGHVDPVSAGSFRKSQVFVGKHTPPAASDVEILMEEFIQSLQSLTIENMHPIHIAAYAHHRLVFIHPFTDGNGRTARLLMNVIFIKYGYPPIIIRKEDRSQYYKYLQMANDGDIRPFYRFIARATENTVDAFLCSHNYQNCKNQKALESKNDVTHIIPLH